MGKQNMYKDSPKMERDESGSMKVKKKTETAPKTDGEPDDAGPGLNDPSDAHKEMQKRHQEEMKDMHNRHLKEVKSTHTKHQKAAGETGGSTVDEPIEKVEKGAKA